MDTVDQISQGGIHTQTAMFFWEPLDLLAGPFGIRTYSRRFSFLDANDASQPAWQVHVWGSHVQQPQVEVEPVIPADAGAIDGGFPTFPAQVAISWSTGGVRRSVIVDASGDVIYNVPPAKNVTVAAMLPPRSARLVTVDGGRLIAVESEIPPSPSVAIAGRLNATAYALHGTRACDGARTWSPLPMQERSRNRHTIVVDIAGNGNAALVVPAGAHTVMIYDSPATALGLVSPISGRWLAWLDAIPANAMPLGNWPLVSGATILQRSALRVPAMATHLQVFVTGANLTRVTAVFDID